ncbi:J domain-containing protein [Methanocella arvoryzae]|uniref:J domain-containing protein n=1 Tax=Methanocella arvoryzae (strain DSM 22066 / NBRC 105507 / MRE50) TaxID=351160 RepID=Q0W222_METAR|nr:J domain-containing protein [Methanocella arvoryzae]CAJ37571.1 hypothetical protein RCIX2503 [Methanocella arvoryzae MRE50]
MEDIRAYLNFFGVGEAVDEEELKRVRNVFLKRYHPDSGEKSDEMAKKINIAYEKIAAFIEFRDQIRSSGGDSPGFSDYSGLYNKYRDSGSLEAAQEFYAEMRQRQGAGLRKHAFSFHGVYEDQAPSAYKHYFVDAVLNYTYLASKQKDIGYTCGQYLEVFPLNVFARWVEQVYPEWQTDRPKIWAEIRGKNYKTLFIAAVEEYTRTNKCAVRDALLAFRIPESKYYYWKSCKVN